MASDLLVQADLPAEIFDVEPNIPLMHQVVVAQQAAARQGTHATKTRGEVRGGGRKPYKQKGTCRARQGSIRAPQFTGGGVVHGPVPRDYSQRTPKKMKAAALRGALSDRARNGRVHVVSALVPDGLEKNWTKNAAATLAKVSESKNVLVVAERSDELTWRSLRNVVAVHLLEPGQLNTYDVLISDDVVFTRGALDAFLAGPAKGKSAKGAASSDEVDEVAEVAAQSIEATEDAEAAAQVSAEKPAKKAPAKKAAAKTAAPAEDGNAEVAELSSSDESDAADAAKEEDA